MKSGEPRDVKKYLKNPRKHGGIAQLGEHLLCKQGVSGSIPLISTSREPRHADGPSLCEKKDCGTVR